MIKTQVFTYNWDTRRFFVNRPTLGCIRQLENEVRAIFSSSLDNNTRKDLTLNDMFKYVDFRIDTIIQVLSSENTLIDKPVLRAHLKDYVQHEWQYNMGKLATVVYFMFKFSSPIQREDNV